MDIKNIKKICSSKLHNDILRFFHNNPASIDTARGISTWVNKPREDVKKILDMFVEKEILIAHKSSSTIGYAYTNNQSLDKKINKYLTTLEE